MFACNDINYFYKRMIKHLSHPINGLYTAGAQMLFQADQERQLPLSCKFIPLYLNRFGYELSRDRVLYY